MEQYVTRIGDVTIQRVMPSGSGPPEPMRVMDGEELLRAVKEEPLDEEDDEEEGQMETEEGAPEEKPEDGEVEAEEEPEEEPGKEDPPPGEGGEEGGGGAEGGEEEEEEYDEEDEKIIIKAEPQDGEEFLGEGVETDQLGEKEDENEEEGLEEPEKDVEPQEKEEMENDEKDEDNQESGDSSKRKAENDNDDDEEGGSKKKRVEIDVDLDKKKISNLRRNIREVMDETQLDESTLAAQRQEAERLRRVQDQQKYIREVQRQIQLNRQNSKTQSRVISLLQGGSTSILKTSSVSSTTTATSTGPSTVLVKVGSGQQQVLNRKTLEVLRGGKSVSSSTEPVRSGIARVTAGSKAGMVTPSVSIAPVKPVGQGEPPKKGRDNDADVVTISSSSDSEDDCIVISEGEEEEEEEEEEDVDPTNSGMHTNDLYNIPDDQGRVLINIGKPEGEREIFLAPQIARVIKPHQIGGVRFLFDNIVESLERFDNSTGFGCILAHSMGLGKTLQVVSFCDVFLRETSAKTVMCIMPINTLQNWMSEFNMWLPTDPTTSPLAVHGEVRPRHFQIFVLNDLNKTVASRARVVEEWNREGGVLLIGYEMYRQLSMKKAARVRKGKKKIIEDEGDDEKNKPLFDSMHEALVKPGPDLVICDEGHRIKNSHASISHALKQIRSKRRVVLTGYPLQNNLLEYWCMVDFVRPNYLGTKTEFSNMFERPIQNGQCIDSTPQDIRLMRYRAHVLHSLLEGFVQRRSHSVLRNSLPQKEEYVLLVRMTPLQRKLYDTFMNEVVRTKAVPNPLKAFAVCCKIWNHPDILYNFLKKKEMDELQDLDLEETAALHQQTGPNSPRRPLAKEKRGKKEVKKAQVAPIKAEVTPQKENLPQTPDKKSDDKKFGYHNQGGGGYNYYPPPPYPDSSYQYHRPPNNMYYPGGYYQEGPSYHQPPGYDHPAGYPPPPYYPNYEMPYPKGEDHGKTSWPNSYSNPPNFKQEKNTSKSPKDSDSSHKPGFEEFYQAKNEEKPEVKEEKQTFLYSGFSGGQVSYNYRQYSDVGYSNYSQPPNEYTGWNKEGFPPYPSHDQSGQRGQGPCSNPQDRSMTEGLPNGPDHQPGMFCEQAPPSNKAVHHTERNSNQLINKNNQEQNHPRHNSGAENRVDSFMPDSHQSSQSHHQEQSRGPYDRMSHNESAGLKGNEERNKPPHDLLPSNNQGVFPPKKPDQSSHMKSDDFQRGHPGQATAKSRHIQDSDTKNRQSSQQALYYPHESMRNFNESQIQSHINPQSVQFGNPPINHPQMNKTMNHPSQYPTPQMNMNNQSRFQGPLDENMQKKCDVNFRRMPDHPPNAASGSVQNEGGGTLENSDPSFQQMKRYFGYDENFMPGQNNMPVKNRNELDHGNLDKQSSQDCNSRSYVKENVNSQGGMFPGQEGDRFSGIFGVPDQTRQQSLSSKEKDENRHEHQQSGLQPTSSNTRHENEPQKVGQLTSSGQQNINMNFNEEPSSQPFPGQPQGYHQEGVQGGMFMGSNQNEGAMSGHNTYQSNQFGQGLNRPQTNHGNIMDQNRNSSSTSDSSSVSMQNSYQRDHSVHNMIRNEAQIGGHNTYGSHERPSSNHYMFPSDNSMLPNPSTEVPHNPYNREKSVEAQSFPKFQEHLPSNNPEMQWLNRNERAIQAQTETGQNISCYENKDKQLYQDNYSLQSQPHPYSQSNNPNLERPNPQSALGHEKHYNMPKENASGMTSGSGGKAPDPSLTMNQYHQSQEQTGKVSHDSNPQNVLHNSALNRQQLQQGNPNQEQMQNYFGNKNFKQGSDDLNGAKHQDINYNQGISSVGRTDNYGLPNRPNQHSLQSNLTSQNIDLGHLNSMNSQEAYPGRNHSYSAGPPGMYSNQFSGQQTNVNTYAHQEMKTSQFIPSQSSGPNAQAYGNVLPQGNKQRIPPMENPNFPGAAPNQMSHSNSQGMPGSCTNPMSSDNGPSGIQSMKPTPNEAPQDGSQNYPPQSYNQGIHPSTPVSSNEGQHPHQPSVNPNQQRQGQYGNEYQYSMNQYPGSYQYPSNPYPVPSNKEQTNQNPHNQGQAYQGYLGNQFMTNSNQSHDPQISQQPISSSSASSKNPSNQQKTDNMKVPQNPSSHQPQGLCPSLPTVQHGTQTAIDNSGQNPNSQHGVQNMPGFEARQTQGTHYEQNIITSGKGMSGGQVLQGAQIMPGSYNVGKAEEQNRYGGNYNEQLHQNNEKYPGNQQNTMGYGQDFQNSYQGQYQRHDTLPGPSGESFKNDDKASHQNKSKELDKISEADSVSQQNSSNNLTSTGTETEDKDSKRDEEEKGDKKMEGKSDSTTPQKKEEPGIPYDWATEILKGYIPGDISASAKMAVFFCILEESIALGDRILLFSQSLFTLNLMEELLQQQFVPGRQERWAKNINYYRLDGSTTAMEREKLINEFNSNANLHLFLVSTRAGSLGINLVGANRVIVFDASWNPCHDTQAVCRVYRYGQKKPCFVYRLVTDNCLEKKIYDRQINKQGMSDRVVDECNPDAHLSIKEVTSLCWDDKTDDNEPKDFSSLQDQYIDVVLQKVIQKHSSKLSKEPFAHESLLVDRKEKKLSQAEKRLAKRSYELEKQASTRPMYNGVNQNQVRPKPMASVRPMQAEMGQAGRPRGWIPASVWQRQGMSAQEMTLPLDVVIPTNSADRASIVLKAGQKVMVLKSPKGIYMQLENGKIIAIRTAFKVGGKKPGEQGKGTPVDVARRGGIRQIGATRGRPVRAVGPVNRLPPVSVTVMKKKSPEDDQSGQKEELESSENNEPTPMEVSEKSSELENACKDDEDAPNPFTAAAAASLGSSQVSSSDENTKESEPMDQTETSPENCPVSKPSTPQVSPPSQKSYQQATVSPQSKASVHPLPSKHPSHHSQVSIQPIKTSSTQNHGHIPTSSSSSISNQKSVPVPVPPQKRESAPIQPQPSIASGNQQSMSSQSSASFQSQNPSSTGQTLPSPPFLVQSQQHQKPMQSPVQPHNSATSPMQAHHPAHSPNQSPQLSPRQSHHPNSSLMSHQPPVSSVLPSHQISTPIQPQKPQIQPQLSGPMPMDSTAALSNRSSLQSQNSIHPQPVQPLPTFSNKGLKTSIPSSSAGVPTSAPNKMADRLQSQSQVVSMQSNASAQSSSLQTPLSSGPIHMPPNTPHSSQSSSSMQTQTLSSSAPMQSPSSPSMPTHPHMPMSLQHQSTSSPLHPHYPIPSHPQTSFPPIPQQSHHPHQSPYSMQPQHQKHPHFSGLPSHQFPLPHQQSQYPLTPQASQYLGHQPFPMHSQPQYSLHPQQPYPVQPQPQYPHLPQHQYGAPLPHQYPLHPQFPLHPSPQFDSNHPPLMPDNHP